MVKAFPRGREAVGFGLLAHAALANRRGSCKTGQLSM